MGIKNAHKLTHGIEGLSMGNIETIVRTRYVSNCDDDNKPPLRLNEPTIDVDVSWLYRSRSNITEDNRMKNIFDLLLDFPRVGISVVLVCDGEERHHSKRATIDRRANTYNNMINGYLARSKLMSVCNQRMKTSNFAEKDVLLKEEEKLSSQIKTLERKDQASKIDVGRDFYLGLCAYLDGIPVQDFGNQSARIYIIRAEYQADSVIAHRLVNKFSEMAFGNDTDLAVLAGEKCLSIKSFKTSNKKICKCDIFTPSNDVVEEITKLLNIKKSKQNIEIKPAECPVLDGIKHPRCRALIAVALGCDVFPPGIRNLRKNDLLIIIQEQLKKKEDGNVYGAIFDHMFNIYWKPYRERPETDEYKHRMMDTKQRFINTVLIYTDALLYEPSNYVTKYPEMNIITGNEADYLNEMKCNGLYINIEPPKGLHKYIEAFACGNEKIEIYGSDMELCQCVGPGNGTHTFLQFEGVKSCISCTSVCCNSCVFGEKGNLCVNCYMEELTIPSTALTNNITTEEMRHQLIDHGLQIDADMCIVDIRDIYDAIINKKQLIYDVDILNDTTIPFEPTNFFTNIKPICNFDVRNGGSFITNQLLSVHNQIDVLILLSSMVDLYTPEELVNKKFNDTKLYSVIPKMLVEFADGARLNGGFRLLKRAARHATDPLTPGILQSSGDIFLYHNEIAISLVHTVKASMKKQEYNTKVSFNSSGIVCCSCGCKAGSSKDEKVLCVHILPVILQFTMLLFDGLAEHVLYEIANAWYTTKPSGIPTNKTVPLYNAVCKLCCAAGKPKQETVDVITNHLILNHLKQFMVGTQTFRPGPGAPDPTTIGPLIQLNKQSPIAKVEQVIKRVTRSSTPKQGLQAKVPSKMSTEFAKVDYDKCMYLVQVCRSWFVCDDDSFNDCVGYKVLRLRSNNLPTDHTKLKEDLWDILENAKSTFRHCRRILGNVSIEGTAINEDNEEYDNDCPSDSDTQSSDNNIPPERKVTPRKPTAKITNKQTDDVSDLSDDDPQDKTPTKQRRKCCAFNCDITTATHKDVLWTKVPQPPIQPTEKVNNNTLRIYHRKVFARREWLKRLGIPLSSDRKFMSVCDNHPIECEQLSFGWYDVKKQPQLSTEFIKVPRDPNAGDIIKTRQQQAIRKPAKRRPPNKVVPKKKVKKGKDYNTRKYCSYVGCKFSYKTTNKIVKFHRVPAIPKLLIKGPTNDEQCKEMWQKIAYRREFLDRIGKKRNDTKNEYRICNHHGVQRKYHSYYWFDHKGKKLKDHMWICLPTNYTNKSSMNAAAATTVNKGNATNRGKLRQVNDVIDMKKKDSVEMLLWQQCEADSIEGGDIHPALINAVGLTRNKNVNLPKPKYGILWKEQKKETVDRNIYTNTSSFPEQSVVQIDKLPKNATKYNTGFSSTCSLVCFVIIICDGDLEKMTNRCTSLTWFEEWYYFFERLYGRTMNRWCDSTSRYKKSIKCLRKLFHTKLNILLECRNKWPRYLSYLEDFTLRGVRWESAYSNKRVVFWDNTNVQLATPSDAEGQRNTYSAYYAGNVAKGAVFIQPSGWMGTHDLWMGAVSDTDYFTRSGILEQQENFLEIYDPDYQDFPWINVLDKGYRVVEAAWRTGKQFVLQPTFAKVDKKFTTYETIRSAAVASARGGNERAVRLAKMSAYLLNGKKQNQSIETLCDVWLAWGFVCNFIYKPVYR